jgi:CheY-like chemotaxis protein
MDETILLVDDSAEMSELLKHILTETGYSVIAAKNGEHALEELARHSAPLDLLLTDVNMPVMSGGELYDRLREWYPGLRVLFMSGYGPEPIRKRLDADLRAGFLPKPFAVPELLAAVRSVLDRD